MSPRSRNAAPHVAPPAPPAPAPPVSPPGPPLSAARRPGATALLWVLGSVVLAAIGVTGLVLYRQRGPAVVERVNAFGELERCATCHPKGGRPAAKGALRPHPAVPGHAELAPIGCTPCHGGSALARDAEHAHQPAIGGGPTAFLPRGWREIGCARCHLLDAKRVALPLLSAGRRLFTESQCIGCHRPGSHPRGLGFDLPKLPQRSVAELRALLLDPGHRTLRTTMWSVTSASSRGTYARGKDGQRPALDALIAYVLMVGDHPQRQRLAARWTPRELRLEGPCTACHTLETPQARGLPHACALLRRHEPMRCARCHAAPAPARSGLCPQLRAHFFQCRTCHLRDGDGAERLIEQALAFPTAP